MRFCQHGIWASETALWCANGLFSSHGVDIKESFDTQFWECEFVHSQGTAVSGYGGWSFADKALQQQGFHRIAANRTIAIENHLPAAVQFARNHDFVMIGSPKHLPPEFLQEHPESTIFVCDIQDHEWQLQLAQLNIEQWRISAPCQSWSFAGKQDGFSCANGMHMAHSIAQTRIHRPKTVVFEQVAGFPIHSQFPIAKRIFQWAGYVEVEWP